MTRRVRNFFPDLLLALVLALVLAGCTSPPGGPNGAPDGPGGVVDGASAVWYVRNDAPGPRFDGSLEAPFATLTDAAAAAGQGDVIYVFAGDGSSRGLDQGVTLAPGQQLIGAGVAFDLGGEALPAGQAPVLANESGPVVTLTRDNVVRGLELAAAGGDGVRGSDVGRLELSDLGIRGAAGDGVRIDGSTVMDVTMRNVTVEGSAGLGVYLLARKGAELRAHVTDSVWRDNAGNAVQLSYLERSSGTFAVTGNQVTSLGSSGVRVFVGDAAGLVTGRIEANVIDSEDPATAGNGLAVILEGDGDAVVAVRGNTISGFGSYGIDVGARGGSGTLDAHLIGNTVRAPAPLALAGMRLAAGNGRPAEANALCLVLSGNRSLGGGLGSGLGSETGGELAGYQQRQRAGTVFAVQGYGGGDIETYATLTNQGSWAVQAADGFAGGSCRAVGF